MSDKPKIVTTTENQKREPYAAAIPTLQTILDGANAAYSSGVGSQVYQSERVAGLGDTTKQGLGFLKENAGTGLGIAKAGESFLLGNLAAGGATTGTKAATQGLLGVQGVDTSGIAGAAGRMSDPNNLANRTAQSVGGGAYNLDASGYQGLGAGLAGPSQTQRSLQDVADGKFLGASNPYTSQIIGQAQDAAASQVKRAYSASGRYGSGMFTGALGEAVARPATELLYRDYDNERTRQAQAAQAIDSGLLSRTSAQAGLLGQVNDVRTANAGQAVTGANLSMQANQAGLAGQATLADAIRANNTQRIGQYGTALAGAQSDRAAAMAGLGAIPGVQTALLQPGRTLLGVGQAEDVARQLQLAADQDKFNEGQQSPWKQLGLLAELGLPIANAGGTATGTTQRMTPQPGILQQALGFATGGLAALGQTGAFSTAAGSSPGWLIALSDERAKENVVEVGATHDGQPLYSFNYRGDRTPQVGLLAQDVARRDPGAVGMRSDGLLAVDYARALGPSMREARR
ncbi:hypothetical protein ASG52_24775 [Methylobacterium sp. Leaf456]|uniref:tail fiber domain-containing protein n=1 Tax=Methylobacterium sp. Leaf456 TaxID=1736382 RepID=UPI0006F61BA4|nr:tail fiber domain-containing protein [Methylobacterium sp. Leaf456]KQT55420.1 hypothetical protein ASG52_24775 [Methylobacterium sp. Leaf456]